MRSVLRRAGLRMTARRLRASVLGSAGIAGILVFLPAAGLAQAPQFLTAWGDSGTGPGQFNGPYGIAVDGGGNVYVVDNGNSRIHKFTSTGTYLTGWGSFGTGNGQLQYPTYAAVDASGNVYVSDRNNTRIQKFTSTGTYLTHWGNGNDPGYGWLVIPTGLAVNSSGQVYSADEQQARIVKFTDTGTYISKWGTPGFSNGQFNMPQGVGVDASSNVFVLEGSSNFRIQKFNSNGGFLRKWGSYGTGDGLFAYPTGLAVDAAGNVYVSDTENQRIQVFNGDGQFVTKWGSLGSGDGQFTYPFGIAVDASGNVYVADGGNHRIQKFGPVDFPEVYFSDATSGSLGSTASSRGVAWGDLNDDGRQDLYVTNGGGGGFANLLFAGWTNGILLDWTGPPINDSENGVGAVWGDYDNDGDMDLYLAKGGSANRLFRVDDGWFVDAATGPLAFNGASRAVSWVDFDNDGNLDLYLVKNTTTSLLRNDGGEDFVDVTPSSLAVVADGLSCAWGDVDNDGDQDLCIGTIGADNRLFRNDGGGTFAEITPAVLDGGSGDVYAVAWCDYDNDGDLDIHLGSPGPVSWLIRNDGGGNFADVTATTPLAGVGGWGVAWGDYDNDGDLDLYQARSGAANGLIRNEGSGTFVDATIGALGDAGNGRGVAWADYDNDGDLDLYLANGGSGNKLFRNEGGTGNHWLEVKLVGTYSNQSGIGARVTAVSGALRQIREVSGGSGYFSQESLPAEFGFGAATVVDTLEIRWPSGIVQRLTNVATNQILSVEEELQWATLTAGPLGDTDEGRGVAGGDFDGDGDPDFYVAEDSDTNRLLRNDGGSSFVDVAGAELQDGGPGQSVATADYDNDGDLDIYLTRHNAANRLFRNDAGAWVNVAAGDLAFVGSSRGAGWADVDHDGDLDLAFAVLVGLSRLLRNDGGSTFVDITPPGLSTSGIGIAWGDYDGDGDPDLYLSRYNGANRLLRNDGGTLVQVPGGVLEEPSLSQGISWGDYDNDGDLDLYLCKSSGGNKLFRNLGNGTFANATGGPLAGTGNSIAADWADVDNDGDLDLYVTQAEGGGSRLLRNDGAGGFVDATYTFAPNAGLAYGMAWGDTDLDGDLDLYVAYGSGSASRLFRNENAAEGNHWLQVNLTGMVSNRSAIGARIRVVTGTLKQLREISGSSGYYSQGSLTAEFGLESAATVDTLEIRWPSGIVQRLTDVAADQVLEVEESEWTDVSQDPVDTDGDASAAWGDYDADGDEDLYVGVDGTNKLLRNDGGNVLVDVTPVILRSPSSIARAVSWADYDNDGDLDLHVTNGLGDTNRLFRNEGAGVFADVTTGPLAQAHIGFSGSWGDYDKDGDVDLYLVFRDASNQLLRNDGGSNFAIVTSGALGDTANSHQGSWVDFDNDGDLDIYLCRSPEPNRLLRNDPGGSFVDVAVGEITGNPGSQSGAWADYDNDGDLDVYLVIGGAPDKLLRNDGVSGFSDVTTAPLGDPLGQDGGVDAAWADYDLDGDLDLYMVNVNANPQRFFRNDGGGNFADLTSGNLGDHMDGGSTPGAPAWGDGDGDGDPDLYVPWGDFVTGIPSDAANRFFRNDAVNTNHWLQVKLVGFQSNRSGIGARIRVRTGSLSQIREVSGGRRSQESLTAAFGLGAATQVDTLEVRWPSGIVQRFSPVQADQVLEVHEPVPGPSAASFPIPLWIAPAGELPGDNVGNAVARAGDVNGDGYDDILVGAPGHDAAGTDAGRAYLYFGGANPDSIPDLVMNGTDAGDSFGYALAGAGDVNGDGYDDWIVGAPFADQSAPSVGRAHLYFGGATPNQVPDLILDQDGWFGYSVAGVGDMNGDGYDDVLVGAFQNTAGGTNAGRAFLYLGGTSMDAVADVAFTGASGERLGWEVVGAGDLNGDGFADAAVRARGAGSIYQARVFFGGSTVNQGVDLVLTGQAIGDGFGLFMDGAGDLNGDGYDDLVIGAPFDNTQATRAGAVRVYLGGAVPNSDSDLTLLGPATNAEFGGGIAGLGDLNGDGFADLGVGAPYYTTVQPGFAYIFLGRPTLSSTPAYTLTGEAASGVFGDVLAGVGDVNQDGLADIGIGSYSNDAAGTDAGRAYVFLGVSDWVDISESALPSLPDGSGAALGDYDGDGDLDVYLGRSSGATPSKLLRNEGSTFVDVTPPGMDPGNVRGVAWGDYNNDGTLDLAVATNLGGVALFRNDGGGSFASVAAGSLTTARAHRGLTWGDFDEDGDLDLVVVVMDDANKYFRNDAGTFVDATTGALGDVGAGRGVSAADYDNDGDLDLYITNGAAANRLLRNDGGGNFANVTSGPLGDTGESRGAAWGDYDRDGDLDLYLVNLSSASKLLRNDGTGFVDATTPPLGVPDSGKDAVWVDVDQDGDLDLFLTMFTGPNHLFRNDGAAGFVDAPTGPLAGPGDSRGIACGDIDADGDLDLLFASQTGLELLRNDFELGNHRLTVRLTGALSNRSAIGAQVRVVAGAVRQLAEVSGGGSWYSQHSLPVEFGLGTATIVDTLEVRWPSGIVSRQTGVASNQILAITENEFFDIATPDITDPVSTRAVAWVDYDADGDLDLSVGGPFQLFRNLGNLSFADVTPTGLASLAIEDNKWGDYDNDGDLDLIGGQFGVFRNDGGESFALVLDPTSGWTTAWGDYDLDGDLDFFLGETLTYRSNKLFRNDGLDTFVDVTPPELADTLVTFSVGWIDYDVDGDVDLCLGNQYVGSVVRNDGGTFALVMDSLAVGENFDWGDYDNDGDFDVCFARGGTHLWRNDGTAGLVDVTPSAFIGLPAVNSVSWMDYDGDGHLDIYFTVNSVPLSGRIFRGQGDGSFEERTAAALSNSVQAHDAAVGDVDEDGDLDLYVGADGLGTDQLLRNDCLQGNHWLQVRLVGTYSNRSGIGALVRAVTGGVSQLRGYGQGSGDRSHDELVAAFGLGTSSKVDSLEIRWPSGTTQVLLGVPADQRITVTETISAPVLEGVLLTAAPDDTTAALPLRGTALTGAGLAVVLDGPSGIPSSIVAASDTAVTALFDLSGKPVGAYDVILVNNQGADTLDAAFVVYSGGFSLLRSTTSAALDGAPAIPRSAGLEDTLIFVSTRDGTGDLYLKDPTGDDTATRLTTLGGVAHPSLSRDGKKIVFDQGDSLRILDLQTMGAPSSLAPGGNPSWSPVDDRIAFVRDLSGGRVGLFTILADGSQLTQLTDPPPLGVDSGPAWSPDGERLVITREVGGSGSQGILVVSASAGESAGVDTVVAPDGALNREVEWSPDGHWLAFSSDRTGNLDLYMTDSRGEGYGVIPITQDPSQDADPAWTPDGAALVFSSDYGGNTDIYVGQALGALTDGDLDLVPDDLDACVATAPADAEVDRDFDGCGDITSSFRFPRFWSEDQLPLYYTTTAGGDSRINDGSEFNDLAAAFATWMGVPGVSLSGGDDGTRSATPLAASGDGINTITFGDPHGYEPLTLAVTLSTVAVADTVINGRWYRPGEIVDADVLFNAGDYKFNTQTTLLGAGAYDLHAVAVHEFGHFLGLAHSAIKSSTMYPVVPLSVTPWTLESDDKEMVMRGYGAPSLTVSGRVLRGDGTTPIVGAAVFAVAATGDTLRMTLSGMNGGYRFFDINQSFRIWMHPLDGDAGVNGITPAYIGSTLHSVAETDFNPEYWDDTLESNHDGGPGAVITRPGPVISGADIIVDLDLSPPQVMSTIPVDGDTSASATAAVSILFNEPLDFSSIDSNDISLRNMDTDTGLAALAAGLREDSLLVITPDVVLDYDTNYRVTLATDIADLAGNNLADSVVVDFKTEQPPAVTLTTITPGESPASGAIVLYGSGFDPDPAGNLVAFTGGATTLATAATLDRVYAIVPEDALTGNVTVTVGSVTSNGLPLEVLAPRAPPKGNLAASLSLNAWQPRKIDLSPDGTAAYVGTSQGLLVLDADPATLSVVKTLALGDVVGVAAMPDGKRLFAVARLAPHLRVVDTDPANTLTYRTVVKEVDLHAPPLDLVTVPGGSEVVVSFPNRLVLLDAPSSLNDPGFGQELRQWTYAGAPFLGPIAVSRSGQYLFATTGEGKVAVFSLSGSLLATMDVGSSPRGMAPLPDGQGVLGADLSGILLEFDNLGTLQASLTSGGGYTGVEISPEGGFAYAVDLILDRMDVVDLTTATPAIVGSIETGVDPVDLVVGPGGRYLYVVTSRTNEVEVYDTVDGPYLAAVHPAAGGDGTLITLVGSGFDPDPGDNLISIGGTVLVPVDADPAGTTLVVKQTSAVTEGPIAVTTAGKTSNVAAYIVTGRSDPGVFALVPGFEAPGSEAVDLLRSPDGRLLIARTAGGSILVYDADPSSARLHQLTAEIGPTETGLSGAGPMAITPDGTKLYAGDAGLELIRVFAVDPDAAIPVAPSASVRNTSGTAVLTPSDLALSPDGRRLYVAASAEDEIVEVSTDNDSVLAVISGGFTAPEAVVIHPDGTRAYVLLSSTQIGGLGVHVYDVDPSSLNYRALADTVHLSGSVGSVVDLLAIPDGTQVLALTGSGGAPPTYSLHAIAADPGNLATFHTVTGALSLGSGTAPPSVALSQSGRLGFVVQPSGPALRAVILPGLALDPDILSDPALADGYGMAVSPEDARLYVATGSTVSIADLTPTTSVSFVSGTGQTGAVGTPLVYPFVARAAPSTAQAAGAPLVFEASGGIFQNGLPTLHAAADKVGGARVTFIPSAAGVDTVWVHAGSGTAQTTVPVLEDAALIAPMLLDVVPGEVPVLGIQTSVGVNFSEAIDTLSVSTATFPLRKTGEGTPVDGIYEFVNDRRRVVFTPFSPLDYDTTYTYEVTPGLTDTHGNPVVNPAVFSLRTESAPVTVTLHAVSPAAASVGDPVVISGSGFETTLSDNQVTFGGVVANVEGGDSRALITRVPIDAVTAPIEVTARSTLSNPLPFTVVVPAPRPVEDLSGEIDVPTSGQGIAVVPDGSRAYMTSPEGNTTVPIEIGTGTSAAAIPVGIYPIGVAVSAGGDRVYVANYFSNDVSVIDADTSHASYEQVIATIPVGLYPLAVATDPRGRSLYVACFGDSSVLVVDTDSTSSTYNTAKTSVQTGSSTSSVTVSPDGGLIVIGTGYGLLVVNTDSGARTSVQTGSSTQSTAVTPDGGFAIVLGSDGTLYLIDLHDLGSGAKTSVQTGSTSSSVTVSPDGGYVIVSRTDGTLLVFQLAQVGASSATAELSQSPFVFAPVDTVTAGENPVALVFAGRDQLLVVDAGDRRVLVIRPGGGVIACDGDTLTAPGTSSAGSVGLGTADRDTISVELPAGATQVVGSLSWTGAPATALQLRFFQRSGGSPPGPPTLLEAGISTASPETVVVQGLAPGSYFFEVVGETVSSSTPWSLTSAICAPEAIGIEEPPTPVLPAVFRLEQSRPNPFHAGRGRMFIQFRLPETGDVRLEVYDVRGALVRTLVRGRLDPGIYDVPWDGHGDSGVPAASGVYFYRLEVRGRFTESKRMLLLR